MKILSILVLALVGYLLLWPVPIDPIVWEAPTNAGFTGAFAQNNRLAEVERLKLPDHHGPEALALRDGVIYMSTREGWILRHNIASGTIEPWVETGGAPLGLAFDRQNNLLVADAYRGLLSISPDGVVSLLADEVHGVPIDYADDVDVAYDGRIYFSDASSKYGSEQFGGSYEASLLDLMEHGGYGRLLVYDPKTQQVSAAMTGLSFANGVAIDDQSRFVLVNETGEYRIHKYWLKGPKAGQSEILIDNLPGFPDNIVRGRDGRFWVGLVSPRSDLLDVMADKPFVRKIVQRLPSFMRPAAANYSHVFAINEAGEVLTSLQDPAGTHHTNTGALETDDWLYISSLHDQHLARLPRAKLGF